jgi:transmembrane sensor
MSTQNQATNAISDTAAIMDMAADWLERVDRAGWSKESLIELETWLSQSSANRVAYWRVKNAWERAERLRVVQSADLVPLAGEGRQRLRSILPKIVAVFCALFILAVGASLLLPRPNDQIFSTAIGGHRIVSLSDGTKLELNTDTLLHVSVDAHERKIVLDKGEVYLQVAHNASRPLVVLAGDHRITDLGTKFIVRRDPARFEVALVEGSVRFEHASGGTQLQSVLLMPGDVAVASANTFVVTRKSAKAVIDELGWRRGVLTFDRTALVEVAAEFNRYNRKKIIVADSTVGNCEIFGTFQASNVMSFARVVRVAFGYRVEERGDEIVISR